MIENYRSGLVWKTMRKNPHIVRGLQRAGFTGGWLDGGARRLEAAGRWLAARLLACSLALPARAAADAGVARFDFWALGREGEVVSELRPRVRAQQPGHPRRRAADPLDRRAREAPHRLRRRRHAGPRPARQHLDSRASSPRRPRAARRAACGAPPTIDARPTTSPASGTPTSSTAPLYGIPWYVDTRVLFYRTRPARRGRLPGAAAHLERVAGGDAARSRPGSGPERYAILLPIDEYEQPVILGRELGAGLLRDGDRYGAFRSPAFRAGRQLLRRPLPQRPRPGVVATARSPTSTSSSPPATSPFYITGPWNVGEFRRRLPPEMQDKWTTAPMPAPDALARLARASRWPAAPASSSSAPRRHPEEAWKLDRVPLRSRRSRSASTSSPATCRRGASAWGDSGARRRPPDRRLPRPARAGGAGSQGAGVGGDQRSRSGRAWSPPSAAARPSTPRSPISTARVDRILEKRR